jgi:PTS system nitrogen regulatory IIA component
MRLGSLTGPELIFLGLSAGDRTAVLRTLAEKVAAAGLVGDAGELLRKLVEREQLGSTGIGGGVAIPHCKLQGLKRGVVAVAMLEQGVDFGAADGQPVRLFFLVVSPSESPAEHLQILAAISRWLKTGNHVEKILALRDRDAIYDLLQEGT